MEGATPYSRCNVRRMCARMARSCKSSEVFHTPCLYFLHPLDLQIQDQSVPHCREDGTWLHVGCSFCCRLWLRASSMSMGVPGRAGLQTGGLLLLSACGHRGKHSIKSCAYSIAYIAYLKEMWLWLVAETMAGGRMDTQLLFTLTCIECDL